MGCNMLNLSQGKARKAIQVHVKSPQSRLAQASTLDDDKMDPGHEKANASMTVSIRGIQQTWNILEHLRTCWNISERGKVSRKPEERS